MLALTARFEVFVRSARQRTVDLFARRTWRKSWCTTR